MTWRRTLTETRLRFLLALAGIVLIGFAVVRAYPEIHSLSQKHPGASSTVQGAFHSYAWAWWYSFNFAILWTIAACILTSGGLVDEARRGTAAYTLSLPVRRSRLLWERSLVILVELVVLAFAGAVVIPLAAATVGVSYPWGEALFFGASMLLGGLGVFALAVLVSTFVGGAWLQPLVSLGLVFLASSLTANLSRDLTAPTPLRIMSAWSWVEIGRPPFLGWLASGCMALILFALARVNLNRRDF
jgi:ABC-type transport system involved in multi-copper enzyme maturation permease subunit